MRSKVINIERCKEILNHFRHAEITVMEDTFMDIEGS